MKTSRLGVGSGQEQGFGDFKVVVEGSGQEPGIEDLTSMIIRARAYRLLDSRRKIQKVAGACRPLDGGRMIWI